MVNFVLASLALVLAAAASVSAETAMILQPCGSSSLTPHAIVVDAHCQRISDSGAFSIAQLGVYSDGTKVGFSASSDCSSTYPPKHSELAALGQSQNCNTYVVGKANSTATNVKSTGSKAHSRSRKRNSSVASDGQRLKYVMLVKGGSSAEKTHA